MLEKKILERLFRQHYSEMLHLATTLLGDGDEAEDIVQDVFARLMTADVLNIRATAGASSATRAYLMAAVHHACMNAIQRHSLRQRIERLCPVDESIDLQPTESMAERLEAILNCVDHLEEPSRSVFRLRFDENMTLKEIASHLQMNPNTVYKHLRKSILEIREKCIR